MLRGFFEGMKAEGETEIICLCRSAWAGSQRYGGAVWSGIFIRHLKICAARCAPA
jgi:alpha-glucosidase (family GH31 glycosyl hydrolase)